nr:PQQ-binding-like beta-propeller repeat protein [Streptomyces buecherae]
MVGRAGDLVVVFGRGRLFGVNLRSHQRVWTTERTYTKGAAVVGDRVVALRDKPAGDNQVVALSEADGKELWTAPRSGLRLSTDAAVTVCAGRAGVEHGWIAANAESPAAAGLGAE